MTKAIKRYTFMLVAVGMLAIIAITSLPTSAQQPSSGSGLRVSPTRSNLSIISGDTREITQTVKNVTQNPVTVEPVLNDFESDGITGEPRLIGDPEIISAYSLREFIEIPASFDLQPDEERELKINVTVPDNASPGAYFGTVLYRASPQGAGDSGQVALIASVGSLVLLEVPGDITEKIEVKDISAYLGDSSGSLFTKKPDAIGTQIENQGNSFSQPFGKVSVKDWRGNEIFLYELNDTQPRGNILPDSTRLFSDELFDVEVKTINDKEEITKTSPIKWPGRYTITGNVSHGTSGEIFTVSTSFWYVPLWLIIVIAGLLVVLVGGALFLYKKYVTRTTKRRKQ